MAKDDFANRGIEGNYTNIQLSGFMCYCVYIYSWRGQVKLVWYDETEGRCSQTVDIRNRLFV